MSDTPETDRKQGLFECSSCGDCVVPADFARQLERELNEARTKITDLINVGNAAVAQWYRSGCGDRAMIRERWNELTKPPDAKPQPWTCSKCGSVTRNAHGYCDACTGRGKEGR